MIDVTQLCEIAMLCIFGASWPFNIAKSIRSKTAKGKSVMFELLVILGYCFGLDHVHWHRRNLWYLSGVESGAPRSD